MDRFGYIPLERGQRQSQTFSGCLIWMGLISKEREWDKDVRLSTIQLGSLALEQWEGLDMIPKHGDVCGRFELLSAGVQGLSQIV